MKTVKHRIQSKFSEKGSKFIGYLFSAGAPELFKNELKRIKAKHPDASHHCYAWRIDPHKIGEFAQDDGEPSGSAGLPILNKLKSFNMVNSGCIVVRYFGGTELGKSGLIEAYDRSARLCLEQASLHTVITTVNFKITYPYDKQTQIDHLKKQFDLKEIDAEYLAQVTLKIACRTEQANEFFAALKALQHQGVEAEKISSGFVTL